MIPRVSSAWRCRSGRASKAQATHPGLPRGCTQVACRPARIPVRLPRATVHSAYQARQVHSKAAREPSAESRSDVFPLPQPLSLRQEPCCLTRQPGRKSRGVRAALSYPPSQEMAALMYTRSETGCPAADLPRRRLSSVRLTGMVLIIFAGRISHERGAAKLGVCVQDEAAAERRLAQGARGAAFACIPVLQVCT